MMILLFIILLLILLVLINSTKLEQFNNQGACPFLVEIGKREGN
jgi:competence protein ComGC